MKNVNETKIFNIISPDGASRFSRKRKTNKKKKVIEHFETPSIMFSWHVSYIIEEILLQKLRVHIMNFPFFFAR